MSIGRGNIVEGQTEIQNFVQERPAVCGKRVHLGANFREVGRTLLGRRMHDGWHKLLT